ncbi:SH3 domain-containing protein [Jannaschia sp. W003]|uniref:SH3 domain-containing protein n=1 Tax=Jannaschia sp. W003 TaxID=2867012 RepID=UPI0021A8048A|nr:SH3 domain-containing protein [Jannaschia sp. W003]UWQ21254.1 SH3 domain-containing protein [Jannaschia sp. W003]
MFRLTFTLAAALYAGFVIWGDPDQLAEERAPAPVILAENAAPDGPVVLETNASSRAQVTRDAAAAPAAALIAAAAPAPADTFSQPALIGEPKRVSLVEPAATPVAVTTASVDGVEGLMKVSGSRVNLRLGPSTGNGVVDSLVRGTLVEQIGDPVNGWVELRDVATGATGYMAARFLEPA